MSYCCMCASSSVSRVPLLRPHGLQPARLLCPWDLPGKNTGVGCHFLLQGIFPTQGSNPSLLHWQVNFLPLRHQGSHAVYKTLLIFFFNLAMLGLQCCADFLSLQRAGAPLLIVVHGCLITVVSLVALYKF